MPGAFTFTQMTSSAILIVVSPTMPVRGVGGWVGAEEDMRTHTLERTKKEGSEEKEEIVGRRNVMFTHFA